MDDLFKSVSLFRDGVQQLAITAGVKNAADQVQQVNMSMNDELEKRKAQGQIAQQLGMQLSAIGAPVSQIQQAVGTIAPPQIKNANDAYNQALQTSDPGMMKMAKDMSAFENKPQMDLQNDAQAHTSYENKLSRDLQKEIAGMKSQTRLQQHELHAVEKVAAQFESSTKSLWEGRNKAKTAIDMLNSDNPVGDTAVLNLLVKATGDTGAITDSDRETFSGSKQVWDRMLRRIETNIVSGKLTDQDRKDLQGVANLLLKKSEVGIDEHASRFSRTLGNRLGVDAAELKPKIFAGFDNVGTSVNNTQQAPQGKRVKVKSKTTGQLVDAIQTPDGKLIPVTN